jgi:hypothetical protein
MKTTDPGRIKPGPVTRPATKPTATKPVTTSRKAGGHTMPLFGGNKQSNPPADAGSNFYGGNGRYGAGPDDRSMFAYGRSLRHGPEAFEDFAKMLDEWAREGEDSQPVDISIPEQIRAAAQVIRSLGSDSTDWYANYRRREDAAEARMDAPARGSRAVEEKRDLGAARREGY